uniref:G_PROTEIN_RECEP_F1_2 domain-containing protein n=1 Tax=Steinernema glaseri TaxID=37863 RepID=A0A1I7ZKW9_9BILA
MPSFDLVTGVISFLPHHYYTVIAVGSRARSLIQRQTFCSIVPLSFEQSDIKRSIAVTAVCESNLLAYNLLIRLVLRGFSTLLYATMVTRPSSVGKLPFPTAYDVLLLFIVICFIGHNVNPVLCFFLSSVAISTGETVVRQRDSLDERARTSFGSNVPSATTQSRFGARR